MWLQRFGFKESTYERPQQKWTCGRIREGESCNAGPTGDGRCGATFECFPQRVGDRWNCTRDALDGGKCKNGPRPDGSCSRPLTRCLPVLSLRTRRGRFAKWTGLLVAGLILLLVTGPHHERFISPGELSFGHSAETIGCADCHSAAMQGLSGWLTAAVSRPNASLESELCVSCHVTGEAPLNAHGLPSATLTDITERLRSMGGSDPLLTVATGIVPIAESRGELACVRCHTEHQGHDARITKTTDGQCQACHVIKFDSFADGHPAFGDYPFGRRTRIVFDHDSHRGKHYPEEERTFACGQCHQPDLAGETMVVRPFEAACAECHSAEIHGSGQTGDKGIPVLVVPGLDMVLIEERGLPIGEWPEDAERGVPPLMQILLQADPAYREIAPRIAGLDLLDLSDADDETVAAVEVLAWSVKRLFHELASGGQEALQGRLEAVLGEISADQLVALSGMLPADAVQRVNLAWFPNLADEVAKHHRGQRVPFRIADREPDDAVPVTSPAKEVSADTAGILDSAEEESADILGEPDVSGETSDILGGSDDTGESLNILGESNVTGEEDILGGLQGNEIDVLGETEETETLSSSPSTEVNPEETAKAGGWYREYFALFFRPAGHEDRFYRRWLESASAAMKTNPSLAVEATLDLFTATETPGRCIKCHSVDRDEHGLVEVNWHAKRPNPERHHSTRFSHNAHLSLTGDAGCLYCHAWRENPSDDFLAAYGQEDPFVDSGNFKHLEKAVCTECHRPGQVTDSCLNCHNYHVVESDLNVPEAMATLDSSDANAL